MSLIAGHRQDIPRAGGAQLVIASSGRAWNWSISCNVRWVQSDEPASLTAGNGGNFRGATARAVSPQVPEGRGLALGEFVEFRPDIAKITLQILHHGAGFAIPFRALVEEGDNRS